MPRSSSAAVESSRSTEWSVPATAAAFLGVFALGAAQIGAAFWFGGYSGTAQSALVILVALGVMAAWVGSSLLSSSVGSPPIVIWFVLGGVVLGFVQLSGSPWLAATVGSEQAAWRRSLTSEAGVGPAVEAGATEAVSSGPLTLDPFGTRRDLALLATAAAVLIGSFWIGRLRTTSLAALILAATGGAVYAIFGLVQQMTWNGKIYWMFETPNQSFGSIVNPNNGAGYLTMCVAAALGLVIAAFGTGSPKNENEVPLSHTFPDRLERWGFIVRRMIAELTARKLSTLVLLAATTAGVFCTLSRGGTVSLIGAALLTTCAVLVLRRSASGMLGALLTLGLGIGLTAWVGMSERVRLEMLTLTEEDAADVRLELWQSVMPIASRFGLLGTGLGTFRHVNRGYLSLNDERWFVHAENLYVEGLIDAGWLGLFLMVGAMGAAAWGLLRSVRDARSNAALGAATAGLFALISQGLHATFDFGLYMPSNAWLLAMLTGVGLAAGSAGATTRPSRSRRSRRSGSSSSSRESRSERALVAAGEGGEPSERGRSSRRSLRRASSRDTESRRGETTRHRSPGRSSLGSIAVDLIVVVAVTLGLAWGWGNNVRSARLERVVEALPTSFDDLPEIRAGEAGYATLAAWDRELAAQCRATDSVDAWLALADIRLAAFRNRWLRSFAPEQAPPEVLEGLARLTDPLELHRRCQIEALVGGPEAGRRVAAATGGKTELEAARQALVAGRRSCPVRPRVHLQLAVLDGILDSADASIVPLARCLELAPRKASFQLVAGLLDYHAGRPTSSLRWRRALELDARNESQRVLRYSLQTLSARQILDEIIPEDPTIRFEIASRVPTVTLTGRELKDSLLEVTDRQLATKERTPAEAALWGRICRTLGRPADAVKALDEALARMPYDARWRYELADALLAIGELDRARSEIERVISLDNDWKAALQLRDRIRNEANRSLRPSDAT